MGLNCLRSQIRMQHLPPTSRQVALKIVLLYLIISLFWIFFSDQFLSYRFDDPLVLSRFQTYKGLLFVLVSSVLLFFLIWRYLRALQTSEGRLLMVSEAVSAQTGAKFFHLLAEHLQDVLKADCVLVAAADQDNLSSLETIAMAYDDDSFQKFRFNLENTPCERLRQNEICYCPFDVRGQLPKDHPFSKMGMQSCLAMPLVDAQQRTLGVMVVMNRGPFPDRAAGESMMRIFASRAASELERRLSEERISQLAFFDPLTGLPNQQRFSEQLDEALHQIENSDQRLALMYLDFDRFKTISRALGVDQSNRVLCDVASRLKTMMPANGFLSHLKGDEFALLLQDFGSLDDLQTWLKNILDAFRAPFPIAGHDLYVTVSVGVAIAPDDGRDSKMLLRNADVAVSRAKALGRNNYQLYSAEMGKVSFQSMVLENRLFRAMEREEFLLLYQPQCRLDNGVIEGMEALVCWKQGGRSQYSPSDFIPKAEETGLIDPLGEWILETACAQNRAWQQQGLPPQRVAVNVSARQFHRRDIVDLVARILRKTGLEARWLALELTESVLFQDISDTAETLGKLRELGVHLIIDDFGTGYSSLSYLQNFPLGTLKIDQSFIAGIPADTGSDTITSAVIAMAHHMGMDVVAEGVEKQEQMAFLRENGCDKIQGFLFSAALPPQDFAALLSRTSNKMTQRI